MKMKTWMTAFLILIITLGSATLGVAQEDTKLPPTDEEQQKEKADREKKAFALLEQVVDESQMLKLPENRVRVQIGAANLLWQRNESRARTLFALAAESVAEMLRSTTVDTTANARRRSQTRTPAQLRQELVLTAARHDATLAYQLLAATRLATPPADARNTSFDSEDNLEQRLLAQVAALDPKLALQNAEQMLDKGQYSRTLADVLAQLQTKDKEAAAKLEDKMIKRLQSSNMLSTLDAGSLALSLLRSGPRPAENATGQGTAIRGNSAQVLAPSAYAGLMGSVIDAALKASPQSATNQRTTNRFRGRNNAPGGGGGGRNSVAAEPTTAELEQMNARRLLGALQGLLPQIDQYLPARGQAVRQKMTEVGMSDNSRARMGDVLAGMQQATSDTLLATAPSAPARVQSRIFQQAALKALEEGDADRARQIANDHLEPAARDSVLRAVNLRQTSEKVDGSKMDEVRHALSGLRSDDERIDFLLQLSNTARVNDPKLAVELLDEARQFTNRRASSYQQFEQQLKVADAFKDLEPARSFEILEPGIVQLNELLAAAATLSGFEVNVFQDGELPLEGRNGLSNMVNRYGEVLGGLAKNDFDRSQTLANRFYLSETRIVARLSIVRSLLGLEPASASNSFRFRRLAQDSLIQRPQ